MPDYMRMDGRVCVTIDGCLKKGERLVGEGLLRSINVTDMVNEMHRGANAVIEIFDFRFNVETLREAAEMFEKLKNLNVDRLIDTDEAVAMHATGKALLGTYAEFGMEAPGWLTANLAALTREIRARNAENVAKKLADLKARRSSLRTAAEQRADIEAEIARLEAASATA